MAKKTIAAEPQRPKTFTPDEQIDVRGARATYGQMCDLGRVIDEECKKGARAQEMGLTKRVLKVLHPNVEAAITVINIKYAFEAVDAVLFWRGQENKRLKYEPSEDERQAGFDKLAGLTGPRGVAVSIGKDFSTHPDEVFNWTFGSVFTILEVDLARFNYNRRLSEIRERKKEKGKHR